MNDIGFKILCVIGVGFFGYHILTLYIDVARFLFNNW